MDKQTNKQTRNGQINQYGTGTSKKYKTVNIRNICELYANKKIHRESHGEKHLQNKASEIKVNFVAQYNKAPHIRTFHF